MPTPIAILVGLGLLGVLAAVARGRGSVFAALRPWFTGFWALAAAVNLYVAVAFLRQPFAAGLPGFVAAALVPIAAAYAVQWLLDRRRGAGGE